MGIRHNGRIYRTIYADRTLTDAWRKVRRGSDAAGSDGVTVAHFEARLFENLRAIQDELQANSYAADEVRRYQIPKSNGKRRSIGVLTVRDRVAQRAVIQTIEPLLDPTFEGFSYGYRPGRSPDMAVEHLERLVQQGHVWLVDLDVRDCFDRIDIPLLLKFLKRRLRDRRLRSLIRQWLRQGARTTERGGRLRRTRPKGLLQGSALSPLLANLYLDRFDKWSHTAGLSTIRYADDIVLACRDRAEAERALTAARRCLSRLGLALNADKTTILHAERGLNYLGHELQLRAEPTALEPAPEDDAHESDRDSDEFETADLPNDGEDDGDALLD